MMKFEILGRANHGGFLVANILSVFPRKIRLKICHRQPPHSLHRRQRNLSRGLHSGGRSRTTFFFTVKALCKEGEGRGFLLRVPGGDSPRRGREGDCGEFWARGV